MHKLDTFKMWEGPLDMLTENGIGHRKALPDTLCNIATTSFTAEHRANDLQRFKDKL